MNQELKRPTAARGKSATAPKPVRRRKPTARQMEAIHRRFQPVAASHDYQYLYLPSRYREPISSLRANCSSAPHRLYR
ncbi:hypothetical protein G6F56_014219 [Rhizopus delemar]|nr:hypothetical protein G6F56_014219 [Rhizopus delemar]